VAGGGHHRRLAGRRGMPGRRAKNQPAALRVVRGLADTMGPLGNHPTGDPTRTHSDIPCFPQLRSDSVPARRTCSCSSGEVSRIAIGFGPEGRRRARSVRSHRRSSPRSLPLRPPGLFDSLGGNTYLRCCCVLRLRAMDCPTQASVFTCRARDSQWRADLVKQLPSGVGN